MFCLYFGQPNPEKANRCSWSGKPIPHLNKYNDFGQIMIIEANKDIVIKYSYSKDCRANKSNIIPIELQNGEIELARWFGSTSPTSKRADKSLKDKLEDKFNQKAGSLAKQVQMVNTKKYASVVLSIFTNG